MNLLHKIVWNTARQQYVVTSEIARGKTKSAATSSTRAASSVNGARQGLRTGLSRLSCALIAAPLFVPGWTVASTCSTGTAGQSAPAGGSCTLAPYHPPTSHDGVGGAVVTHGGTVTLRGTSEISTGYNGNTTVAASTVNVVSGTFNSSALVTGPQTVAVPGPNAATGTNVVYRTFSSSALADQTNIDTPVNQYEDVNGDEYFKASLGAVRRSGGTLNVNLGDTPAGAPSSNAIMMTAKQTYLTSADGTGRADSRIIWRSRNAIDMGIDPGLPVPDAQGILTVQVPVTTYAGTVTFNGATYTVTNAAQLAAYNDVLVAALRSGQLTSQQGYDNAFNQAFATNDVAVAYQTNTTVGDMARVPNGDRYAILADGARGSAIIATGGQIDITRASGAVKATNGATVINRGTLSGNVIQQVAQVESGAHFINSVTGVVSSGYLVGDKFNTATDSTFYYTGSGILATGASTTVQNSGIINAAGFAYAGNTSMGLGLADGAAGNNDGVINVGVNPGLATRVVGVDVSGGSSFTNAAGGTIYIGRAAQYTLADGTVDVGIDGPTYGVRIMDTGDSAINAGQIVIGSQTQNAVAMYSTAPLNSLLLNTGTITINGAAAGVPLGNVGMLADDNGAASGGAVARNAGIINVNGVNGVGLMVNADPGLEANAESTGTINVSGNTDPASGTRNFGVWVNGAGGVANISGALNLTGTGAIGVFAQNGGTIAVASGSVPQFGGTDQIGFYASGAGSAINVNATALTVDTARSTMFRVAAGATYTGSSSLGALTITVSGTDARGVVATGMGTTLSTGASTYNVIGAAGADGGAVAIVNEGGATGVIDAAATINLAGTGATAGIVDGQAHDLSGEAVGLPVPTSLTNNASIQSATAGTIGFVARNLGTLVNNGAVLLTGASATGVVVGPQGTVENNGMIHVATGDAALVQGAQARLVNNGTIQADDGSAAVHLTGSGASVALSGNGPINAAGTAAGILIDSSAVGGGVTATGGKVVANGSGAALDSQAGGATINLSNTSLTGAGVGAKGAVSITDPLASGRASTLTMTGGSVSALSGSAIYVSGAKADVTVRGGASLSAASGALLNIANTSQVNFSADGVTLVGNLLADDTSNGIVNLRNGTVLTGRVDPLSMNIDNTSAWNVTANSTLASLGNAGMVAFTAPSGNPTLMSSYKTVTAGNYVGTNGSIALNTYLAADNSATDRLIINGGAATGTTGVNVNNTGGPGALTRGDGINVIAVANGGTTAANAFRLAAPVQSGAYQYLLYRGGNANADDYYLRSSLIAGTTPADPAPTDPASPATPVAYRPGVVGYTLTPALNLDYGFSTLGRLHERVGDVASTEQKQKNNHDGVWGRIHGESLDADSGNRFSVDQQTFFMQFGKDWTLSQSAESGSTHAGVTATIGSSSAKFRDSFRTLNATLSDNTGKTITQAQSVGGYFTKYWQDGSYWDSVAQATHYRNKYEDSYGSGGTQNGVGIALSQEVGKPFALASKVSIEPQAQLIYQYLKLDDFNDAVSAVSGNGSSALRGRVGFRIFAPNIDDNEHVNSGTPYLTFDVLHDFMSPGQVQVGGTTLNSNFGRTWGEVGVGISASMGKSGQLYASAKFAKNLGGEERRGVSAQVGYRYSW